MILAVAVILLVAAIPALRAATLVQFNLSDLVDRSDKIFRGTVVEISDGTVPFGGIDLPVRTYTVQLEERFKGTFASLAGDGLVEIRMVRSDVSRQSGDAQFVSVLPRMPALRVGESYMLFTTRPGEIGLSATVGLGQGIFHITGPAGAEQLVNEFGNIRLFEGMDQPELPPAGPVGYRQFSDIVRDELDAL
jgi:hypothetical protein